MFPDMTTSRFLRWKRVGSFLWRGLLVLLAALLVYFVLFPLSVPQLSELDQPPIRQKANGHYVFEEAWSFEVDGQRYEIPPAYLSNGITADIKLKEWLGGNSVHSSATRAAIIHDYFILRTQVNRWRLDRIFYAALRQGDTPWWKAKLMYHGVSLRSLQHWFNGVRHPGKKAPPWR